MDAVLQRVLQTRPSLSQLWNALRDLPGGAGMFSRFVAQLSPYSSPLGARVLRLEEGLVEVALRDRRNLRDANDCVHPAALANLAELTTGLAVRYIVDGRGSAELLRLNIEIVAPARGNVSAACENLVPTAAGEHRPTFEATLRDESGAVVARATALWLITIDARVP